MSSRAWMDGIGLGRLRFTADVRIRAFSTTAPPVEAGACVFILHVFRSNSTNPLGSILFCSFCAPNDEAPSGLSPKRCGCEAARSGFVNPPVNHLGAGGIGKHYATIHSKAAQSLRTIVC